MEIKNYKLDDPIPDLFNQFPTGHFAKTSDGRRWIKQRDGSWAPAAQERKVENGNG